MTLSMIRNSCRIYHKSKRKRKIATRMLTAYLFRLPYQKQKFSAQMKVSSRIGDFGLKCVKNKIKRSRSSYTARNLRRYSKFFKSSVTWLKRQVVTKLILTSLAKLKLSSSSQRKNSLTMNSGAMPFLWASKRERAGFMRRQTRTGNSGSLMRWRTRSAKQSEMNLDTTHLQGSP